MKTKFVNTLKAAETYTHTHTHTGNRLLSQIFQNLIFSTVSILLCTNVYADTTDIAANAATSNCTNTITGTYSGTTNFEAKWTANTIPLRWYNNNTLMQNVNTESNTCNYDGALTIPTTAPERTGYTFAGWKVRPNFDFSTLTSLTTGQKRWAKGLYQNADYCWYKEGTGNANIVSCASDIEFKELERHEWKVKFNTGTMYGTGHCSAKSGSRSDDQWNTSASFATYDQLESASGEKKYCWCQATGWKPSTNNPDGTIYGQMSVSASSAWVFYNGYSSAAGCARSCADYCSYYALYYPSFRRALATGSGN